MKARRDERPVEDPRRSRWTRLAELLDALDGRGAARLSADDARDVTRLYRAASADLLVELRRDPDGAAAEYLGALVGRGHRLLSRGAPPRVLPTVARFFRRDFPETVRRRIRAFLLAAAVLFAGAVYGGTAITLDPATGEVLLVLGNRGVDPRERVAEAERESRAETAGGKAIEGTGLAGWLFRNNVRVTFLAFALAVTGGVGTVLVLFANGAFLGAVAARYVASGKGLFLAAWIGPHGVLEIPAILLGAAASFAVVKAVFAPGIAGRARALQTAGRDATTLLLGAAATLFVAGCVEGTFSQMNEPLVPYAAKIAFAVVLGTAYALYLLVDPAKFAVRRRRPEADAS